MPILPQGTLDQENLKKGLQGVEGSLKREINHCWETRSGIGAVATGV